MVGMVIATPAQRIQPACEAEPGPSVVGKLGEAVALTDEGEMTKALAAMVEIALELDLGRQPQLVDQERRDRPGDVASSTRKRAQKPGGSQHKGEAEAVVVAAQLIDDLPVASVQMKVPRQLVRQRSGGETGIALPLLVGQMAGRHRVRNSGHLRRGRGAPESNGFSFAKHLRGSRCFSNMFCEAPGSLS